MSAAGTIARSDSPALFQRLGTRFQLLLGQLARLYLSDAIVLTSDADRLVRKPKSQRVTVSTAGVGYTAGPAVPAGKRWYVWSMQAFDSTGVTQVWRLAVSNNSNAGSVVDLTPAATAPADEAVQFAGLVLDATDTVGIQTVTGVALSAVTLSFWYEEEDVA